MGSFSLIDQLGRAARLYPDKPALVFGESERSWAEVMRHSGALADALAAMGVGAGERVAILSLNRDSYFSLYFAIPRAGAIAVPINIRLAEPEIVQCLEDCGATTLVVDESFAEVAARVLPLCPALARCAFVGDGDCPGVMVDLRRPYASGAILPPLNETASLFYTGGTTGRPKGVLQTHQGMLFNTMQWIVATGTHSEDRLLIAAPMFHMVAAMNCIAACTLGATLVVLPRFDVEETLAAIERHGITKTALVPTMIDMLIRHEAFGRHDIGSLRKVSYGGAPMPGEILERAQAAMPGVEFIQIYGQTECCGTVSCLPGQFHTLEGPGADKRHSAGRPVVGTEVAILAETGEEMPAGEPGEICVRSPATSPGYWNNPEETAHLYRDGWLRTGDIGYLDSDGFLFVVDRLKDMIVSGGENVFATEVENVIYQLEGVEQCAVIGIPSPEWGEQVHAVIKPAPGCELEQDAVIAHCRSRLANFKCVRSVEFREEGLPVSAMNKILKQELRKPYMKRPT